MTTTSKRKAEEAAARRREEVRLADEDRMTHMVDPLTHPSSGDPPPAISPAGDRLGTVPMTPGQESEKTQASSTDGMSSSTASATRRGARAASAR